MFLRDRKSETAHLFIVLDVLHRHISLNPVNLGGDISRDRVDLSLFAVESTLFRAFSASGRTWHVQRVGVRELDESEYRFSRQARQPPVKP
jgi:hypothetical protein